MVLSLRMLKTFLAVVDEGSVVGAARARGYSPGAVSRQMAKLQRRLGVELFEHEGRGIRPSVHALRLADRSRALIAEAEALEGYLRALSAATGDGGRGDTRSDRPSSHALAPARPLVSGAR